MLIMFDWVEGGGKVELGKARWWWKVVEGPKPTFEAEVRSSRFQVEGRVVIAG